jgi:hypothetical protein
MRPDTPFMMIPISRTSGRPAGAAAGAGARVVVSDIFVLSVSGFHCGKSG